MSSIVSVVAAVFMAVSSFRGGPLGGPVARNEKGTVRRPPLTLCYVVRPLGVEPRTNGLRVRCSAIELEAPSRPEPGCGPEVYGTMVRPGHVRTCGIRMG